MRVILKHMSLLFLGITCLIFPGFSQTENDDATNPTFTCLGTSGLVQTHSAQTLGAGRLSFSLLQTWYKQDAVGQNPLDLAPNKDAQILTSIGAMSFGVNPFIDIFASGVIFTTRDYDATPKSGIGTILAGIEGALPFPSTSPFHLAAQGIVIGGTSGNQLDSNKADGYNYFETRTGYDFMGKLLQSFIFGKVSQGIMLHFNEGAVFSTESNRSTYIMFAAGLQVNPLSLLSIGIEFNSRSTWSDNATIASDPMWVTPSLHFRTPYFMNVVLGADFSVSQARSDQNLAPALAKYRVFAGLDFTFDLLAEKRKADKEKAAKEAQEKQDLISSKAKLIAESDSLSRKMKSDSLNLVQKMKADSVAAVQRQEAEKRRADSLAAKIHQDSIALVDAKKRLQEEMSKRSDAEKQLLSTGMLILDAVYFETGKTEISINSKPYLNIIGKMLTKYPKLVIEIGGHTDNIGGIEANRRLSSARAESVRQYLFQVAPELVTRLTAVGYGPDRPKADNRTAGGRKINRRVEMQVVNKEVLKEYNP